MGGGSGNMAADMPIPANMAEDNISTNQQAQPVAYLAGTRRVAVTWIDGLFEVSSEDVKAGGGKGGDVTTGTNYYASMLGAVCVGPVRWVDQILVNDQAVWTGPVEIAGEYVDITIEGAGAGGGVAVARVYAGSETQLPCHEVRSITGRFHPAYRGTCYIFLRGFALGLNQTNAPNLELVVTREPVPVLGSTKYIGVDPAVILRDLVTNPRSGLGLPESALDAAALAAASALLWPAGVRLSPLITSVSEVKSLIETLCEHCDAFISVSQSGAAGMVVDHPATDPGSLRQITLADLADTPDIEVGDWSGVASEVRATFADLERRYQDNAAIWADRAVLDITGEAQMITIDRPWMTVASAAENSAASAGRRASVPQLLGRASVLMSADLWLALAPGNLFRFSVPERGIGDLVCRVVSRSDNGPGKAKFSIEFKSDRSYLGSWPGHSPRSPKSDSPGAPDDPAVPLLALASVRIVELPLALCSSGRLEIAVLAPRAQAGGSGAQIWIRRGYDPSGALDSFAAVGACGVAGLGTLAEGCGVGEDPQVAQLVIDLAALSAELPDATMWDALNSTTLVWVEDEIMSIVGVEVVSNRRYALRCLRGRFATPVQAHAAGVAAHIVERGALGGFAHAAIEPGNTIWVKVVPLAEGRVGAIADAASIEHAVSGSACGFVRPTNLRVNCDSAAATWAPGRPLRISSDASEDLSRLPVGVTAATRIRFVDGAGDVLGEVSGAPTLRDLELSAIQMAGLVGEPEALSVSVSIVYSGPLWSVESAAVSMPISIP